VAARRRGRVDPDRRVLVPAENVLALAENDLPVLREKPEARVSARPPHGGCDRGACKRVAAPIDRPHEPRTFRVVFEGGAETGDEAGQGRFRDEGIGPEAIAELLLGNRLGAPLEQELEEVERLGDQVDLLPVPEKLAAPGVEDEFTELNAQTAASAGNKHVPGDFTMLAA
jgi:hypothetical protein